jgi:hypothetical protein
VPAAPAAHPAHISAQHNKVMEEKFRRFMSFAAVQLKLNQVKRTGALSFLYA